MGVVAVAAGPLIQFDPVLHDEGQRFLAIADDEEIDERREQFRVLRPRPAGDHQRIADEPFVAEVRDAAEVEHRQHVRVADLILQTETDDIEGVQRREGFEAVERQLLAAEHRFEIEPRREGPLAGPLRIAVERAVEHLEAVVAHAERVSVRKAEAKRAANLGVILGDAVDFAAHVLSGRGHPRQQAEDGGFE